MSLGTWRAMASPAMHRAAVICESGLNFFFFFLGGITFLFLGSLRTVKGRRWQDRLVGSQPTGGGDQPTPVRR